MSLGKRFGWKLLRWKPIDCDNEFKVLAKQQKKFSNKMIDLFVVDAHYIINFRNFAVG